MIWNLVILFVFLNRSNLNNRMAKKGFIYKYTYPNGKVYIGQTRKSVEQRHYEHMSASKDPARRTICEMAIAKYGEPKLDILETVEVEDNEPTKLVDKLNEAEKKWIRTYDSTNRGNGYNIQNGGNVVTPEEFILEEKFCEVYEKEGWGNFIGSVRGILDSMIEKNGLHDVWNSDFQLKSSSLTKEERKVWYGYNFIDFAGEQVTFNSYVKKCPAAEYVSDIIEHAFEDLSVDISRKIWSKIEKKKDKIIKEWYSTKNTTSRRNWRRG